MKKKILVSVAAVLLIVVLLCAFSALVRPKYISNPEGALVGEYYERKGGHDLLFVGDCEVYEGFVPAVLWEQYGITSYVRGSAQQLTWQSYYLLKEMLKYEKPKAVVFNVLALKYGKPQNEAYNRMTLDGMKWSSEKLLGIKSSMTDGESIVDYMFPILRYHSRITELDKTDFKYWLSNTPRVSDSGYLMQTGIVPMDAEGGTPRELSDYTLPNTSMEYLEKMRVLCEENGSELILVKSPTNSWGYYWYDEWEEQVKAYSEEKKLKYYNFIPLAGEMGIDWSTDTYDGGMHLNVYGAEKLTSYFGKILTDSHGFESRGSEAKTAYEWNEYVRMYKNRKKDMEAN